MAAAAALARRPESRNAALAVLGVLALALFGALGGFALALGELDAFWVALALLGCGAVLYDFRIGAVLLIVLLPIADSTVLPRSLGGFIGLNPLNLLLAATFASWLLRRKRADAPFLPKPLLLLYIVPIVFAAILGSQHAQDLVPTLYASAGGIVLFHDALGYLRDMAMKPLVMVVVALLVAAAVAKSKKPERFIAPIVFAVWVMSLLSIVYVAASGVSLGVLSSTGSRSFFAALGMHANDLGRLYAVAYALLLFTWAETRQPSLKALLALTMAALVIALMLTFSRGAFLGFVLVNVLYVLWKFNAKTLALVALAVLGAALVMPGVVYERATLGFDSGDMNVVTAGRIDEIWLPLLPEIPKTPPWGSGLGSIMWSAPMWAGQMSGVGHPHNAYLEALLDLGVIGLCLLLAYFAHVWRRLRDLGSNAYLTPELRGFFQGAAAGLVSFLVTGFAGSSLLPRPEYAFLWLAIGMMYGQLARRPTA